jgi:hypothetical protein
MLFFQSQQQDFLVTVGVEGMKIWSWNEILNYTFHLKPLDSLSCDQNEVFNTVTFNPKVTNSIH